MTSISDSVFGQCSSLTSIVIPNSVTSIGSSVFYGCTGLTSVTIPDSVTSIGLGAFSSCSSLTSITIPASVTSLGNDVFEGCSSLTEIVFLGTEDEWHTLIANTNNSKLDDCTITCTGGSAVSDEHIILSENLQLTDVETEYYSSGILIFSTTVKGPSDVAEVRIASWRSTEPTADEAQEAAQTMVSTLKQSTDSFEPKALPFNVDSSTYVYLSDLGKPRYFILAGMDTSVNLVGYAVIKVDIQGEELLPAPTWTLEPENPTENDLVTIWLDQTYDELRTWLYKDGEPLYGENAVTVRRNCSSIGSSEYEQGSYRFIIDGKKNGFWTEQTIVEFTVVPGENSEKLILPRGLTTIETEAFLDVAASEIDIPDSVTLIGDNAFPDDVTMIVGSGTYAESWAIANGYTPVTR